jgi:hypothetical protein
VNRRCFVVALAAAVSPATFAQEPAPRAELGVRYWLSTGETKHSHNAQGVDPDLGNPTSVLTYSNLDAHVLEFYGRLNFAHNWLTKGNLGLGQINTGSFDDEDYAAGQFKYLDTTSSVTEGRVSYFTIDVGRTEWSQHRGRSTLGAFIGFNQWTEDVDAYGIARTVDVFNRFRDAPDSLLIISNKVIWRSLRVGVTANAALGERTRLSADFAFIPYAEVRNEDSHHLRTDPGDPVFFLGPAPNIIIEGRGRGLQLDAELGYEIYRRTQLGLGLRYWYLEATKGTRTVPGRPGVAEVPLVELYSKRTGLTLSLTHAW